MILPICSWSKIPLPIWDIYLSINIYPHLLQNMTSIIYRISSVRWRGWNKSTTTAKFSCVQTTRQLGEYGFSLVSCLFPTLYYNYWRNMRSAVYTCQINTVDWFDCRFVVYLKQWCYTQHSIHTITEKLSTHVRSFIKQIKFDCISQSSIEAFDLWSRNLGILGISWQGFFYTVLNMYQLSW